MLSRDERELISVIAGKDYVTGDDLTSDQVGMRIKLLITPHKHKKTAKVDIKSFRDEKGLSVLHIAVKHDALTVIETVLEVFPGFDINLKAGKYSETPLHIAIREEAVKCIKFLLDRQQKDKRDPRYFVSELDKFGYCVLHEAIRCNQEDAALLLLQKGANPCTETTKGVTPFDTAFSKKQGRVCEALLELALKHDLVSLFQNIILSDYPIQGKLDAAFGAIKKLLDYKPARREKYRANLLSVRDLCMQSPRNIKYLQHILYDQENTSDEDSSDSENDEFEVVRSLQGVDEQNLLYRSIYFHQNYFKTPASRRAANTKQYHQASVYSNAVRALAENQLSRKKNGSPDYERADELVKNYFILLKLTPDKDERGENGKKLLDQEILRIYMNVLFKPIKILMISFLIKAGWQEILILYLMKIQFYQPLKFL